MSQHLQTYFEHISAACLRCGLCMRIQREEGLPTYDLQSLARHLQQADALSALPTDALFLIRSCSLCGACTVDCPVDLDCGDFMRKARVRLIELEPAIADDYRSYRVDYTTNIFARLREVNGIHYDEMLDRHGKRQGDGSSVSFSTQGDEKETDEPSPCLFFPGCTLASYAPELTRAVFDYLALNNLADGMTAYCCGNPLTSAGLEPQYAEYAHQLARRIREQSITRIIVACPNCHLSLSGMLEREGLPDVELVALPQVLAAQGLRFSPTQHAPYTTVSLHDACPDRVEQCFGAPTRALFQNVTLVEMEHSGKDTLCCGSGGMVSQYNLASCDVRRERRLHEYAQTGADCLVTDCLSCVNSFKRSPIERKVFHYLELLFALPIDWDAVSLRAYRLWDLPKTERPDAPLDLSAKTFPPAEKPLVVGATTVHPPQQPDGRALPLIVGANCVRPSTATNAADAENTPDA